MRSSLASPQRALRQSEEDAAASRADLLIVLCAAGAVQLVRESKLALDDGQVADHRGRCVRPAAAAADGLLAARPRLFVEADTELGRPLEDVKELAEGEIQEREDHRGGMEDREEVV